MEEPNLRAELIAALPEKCRIPKAQCSPAFRAIGKICQRAEAGEPLDIETTKAKLGRCVLGPNTVGSCGTERVVCRHPEVSDVQEPEQQVELLAQI